MSDATISYAEIIPGLDSSLPLYGGLVPIPTHRQPQPGRLLEQARRLYFLLPQPKACLEFLSYGIDGF